MNLDLALLIIRLVVGGLMIGHGAQKLFGAFGGPGLAGATGWLGSLGLRPARLWALGASFAEAGGGLLLALGFLTPFGSLAIAAAMLMAILLAHRGKGLWISNGGSEYNLVLIVIALAFMLSGPGAYSLDALLGVALPAGVILIAAALTVAGVLLALASRRVPAQQTA
jgi:putative oxidoreductase